MAGGKVVVAGLAPGGVASHVKVTHESARSLEYAGGDWAVTNTLLPTPYFGGVPYALAWRMIVVPSLAVTEKGGPKFPDFPFPSSAP